MFGLLEKSQYSLPKASEINHEFIEKGRALPGLSFSMDAWIKSGHDDWRARA
jgi:hypothetical protein